MGVNSTQIRGLQPRLPVVGDTVINGDIENVKSRKHSNKEIMLNTINLCILSHSRENLVRWFPSLHQTSSSFATITPMPCRYSSPGIAYPCSQVLGLRATFKHSHICETTLSPEMFFREMEHASSRLKASLTRCALHHQSLLHPISKQLLTRKSTYEYHF